MRWRMWGVVAATCWGASAVGATEPRATPDTWPTWRGDIAQTGRSPSSLPATLVPKWRARTGDAIVAGAVVDATQVYVGSKDGIVRALDRRTGRVRWSVATEAPVEAPGLRVGNVLVVGSRDHRLRALGAADGRASWVVDLGAEIVGGAAWVPADGAPESVLVGDYAGTLHRVDLQTGREVWRYETGNYIYGSPAIADGHAIFGGCDGYVHAVRVRDGVAVSKAEIGAYVGASIAVDGGAAYTGHFGNRVVGIDWRRGDVRWSHFDRSFPFLSSPAVTKDVVILGGRDHVVRALSRDKGEAWWMFPVAEKVDASPVVVDGRAVVGSSDGRLYVLDLEDGHAVQTLDLGGAIVAGAAVASGWVWVGTEDGVLHAFGPG
jgi:outer membrane protein assembly factor BamB